jgi:hypothetical protein
VVQVRNRVGISLYVWDLATESEVAATRGSTATMHRVILISSLWLWWFVVVVGLVCVITGHGGYGCGVSLLALVVAVVVVVVHDCL